jgi:ferredoxin-type protein NapF
MADPSSRRNFLRGHFSARSGPLRPPWALAENEFLLACTRCGDCVRACPTQVIAERDSGYPVMNFAAGECSFCGECVSACTKGALKRAAGQAPWQAQAAIGEQCLAQRRIECRICCDQCDAGAIRFPLRAGGISQPLLDSARCTGCGACVAACPAGAVSVSGAPHK